MPRKKQIIMKTNSKNFDKPRESRHNRIMHNFQMSQTNKNRPNNNQQTKLTNHPRQFPNFKKQRINKKQRNNNHIAPNKQKTKIIRSKITQNNIPNRRISHNIRIHPSRFIQKSRNNQNRNRNQNQPFMLLKLSPPISHALPQFQHHIKQHAKTFIYPPII